MGSLAIEVSAEVTRRGFLKVIGAGSGAKILSLGLPGGALLFSGKQAFADEDEKLPAPPLPRGRGEALDDIAKKYYGGNREAMLKGIEELPIEPYAYKLATDLDFEKLVYNVFTRDIFYAILTLPDGKKRVVGYQKERPKPGVEKKDLGIIKIIDIPIDEVLEDALRRWYQPSKYVENFRWKVDHDFKEVTDNDLIGTLNNKLKENDKSRKLKLSHDWRIIRGAYDTLDESTNEGKGFLQALQKLSQEEEFADEKVSAAIFYLAKMKNFGFLRYYKRGNVWVPSMEFRDVNAMNGADFYENIKYAVDARHRFSWGEKDWGNFLKHVLPARGSNENFHPWRRQYAEALWKIFDEIDKEKISAEERENKAHALVETLEHITLPYLQTPNEDMGTYLRRATHQAKCECQTNDEIQTSSSMALSKFDLSVDWVNGTNGNHQFIGRWRYEKVEGKFEKILHTRRSCSPSSGNGNDYKEAAVAKIYSRSVFGGEDDMTEHFAPVSDLELKIPGTKPGELYHLNVFNSGTVMTQVSAKVDDDGMLRYSKVGSLVPIMFTISRNEKRWNNKKHVSKEVIGPFYRKDNADDLEGNDKYQFFNGGVARGSAKKYDLTPEVVGHSNAGFKELVDGKISLTLKRWTNGEYQTVVALDPPKKEGEGYIFEGVSLYEGSVYQLFRGERPEGLIFATEDGKLRAMPTRKAG